jgi:ribosomal-protein-alanine N-acetyltransferase
MSLIDVYCIRGKQLRVYLRRANLSDRDELTRLFEESAEFLLPWTVAPSDMMRYLSSDHRMLVCRHEDDAVVGQFNLSYIIRSGLQQAFLGYNAFSPHLLKGYMKEGMKLILKYAFLYLELHRLEANIQPANEPSLSFIAACGFRKEGFSPSYLDIDGSGYKDHERWAITAEECEPWIHEL